MWNLFNDTHFNATYHNSLPSTCLTNQLITKSGPIATPDETFGLLRLLFTVVIPTLFITPFVCLYLPCCIYNLIRFLFEWIRVKPKNRNDRKKAQIKIQLGFYLLKHVWLLPMPFSCSVLTLHSIRNLNFYWFGIAPIVTQCILINRKNKTIYLAKRNHTQNNPTSMDVLSRRVVGYGNNYRTTMLTGLRTDLCENINENLITKIKLQFSGRYTPATSENLDSIIYLYVTDVSECDIPTETQDYESIEQYTVDQLLHAIKEVSNADIITHNDYNYDTGWVVCKFIRMIRRNGW